MPHMKFVIYIVILFSLGLIGYLFTILDFDNLLKGDSANAAIGILASFCVLVLMLILLVSRNIAEKHKE